jgi:hypothetical protein
MNMQVDCADDKLTRAVARARMIFIHVVLPQLPQAMDRYRYYNLQAV